MSERDTEPGQLRPPRRLSDQPAADTRPDASKGPLLPPAPAGADYYDQALKALLALGEQLKQTQGEILDPKSPHNQRLERHFAKTERQQLLLLKEMRGIRRDMTSALARIDTLEERADEAQEALDEHEQRLRVLEGLDATETVPTDPAPAES